MPDSDLLSVAIGQWLESPQGSAVLDAERRASKPIIDRLFGYHILQIGCSDEHSLIESSPIGHKIIFSQFHRPGSIKAVANNEELPLANDSIDVVVLHHALDFTDDSHRLLREVTRVLRPGGQMLIIGFNPFSIWGFWKMMRRRVTIPWRGRFISRRRLADWLQLLNLHIDSVQYGLHFLPFNFSGLLKSAEKLEKFGNRIHSPLGGAYILLCQKQLSTLTPIVPRWRPIRARVTSIPAAENIRIKIH